MLFDVVAPGLIMTLGGVTGGLMLVSIVVLEAALLRVFRWPTIRAALVDAFLMNAVSALAGCAPLALIGTNYLTSLTFLVAAGLLSIFIEGAVLTVRHREMNMWMVWAAAAVVNLVSYIGVGLVLLNGL